MGTAVTAAACRKTGRTTPNGGFKSDGRCHFLYSEGAQTSSDGRYVGFGDDGGRHGG